MKRILALTAIAAVLSIAPALAQQDMGSGMMGRMMGAQGMGGMMGPGMMGAQGMGGMMGPGMMGAQGMGGMMGPGMMGGHGMGAMMGPGMMGGQGMGAMMGPGMMGGQGMGTGMMPGGIAAVNLTDAQRQKIGEIHQEVARKRWDLMAKMQEQQYRMHELESGKADDAEARKAYAAMSASHQQMFETMLDARKRIDAVLSTEQREQTHRGMR